VDGLLTRRALLGSLAGGLGSIALAQLLGREALAAAPAPGLETPHFAPRAKRVIYLTMNGGASQLDLLDPKPGLVARNGQLCPDEMFVGKTLAFIRERPTLLASPYAFAHHGRSGIEVSELLPHFAQVVDDVTLVRSMHTDEFNHTPAELLLLSGIGRFGRPSLGAWVAYGLGSENDDLPAFVALNASPGQPPSGTASFGAAFLPSRFQGVEFRGVGEPVLFLGNPPGVSEPAQRATIDAVGRLNRMQLEETHDPEIETRIAQYELAFRMQMSVPEATDIWHEPPEVHAMYGTTPGKLSFANQCLLARRLVERDVRFVQVFLPGWDDHSNIFGLLPLHCAAVDQAMAALVKDLKQRGLLDDTLVVWATEFGRTPMAQDKNEGGVKAAVGRDHQRDAFTVWMAGGGVKAGFVHGATDELGHAVVANPVHVHDFNATLLHLLGIDHKRLTYQHQGREFRVTDVAGEVVRDVIA
jgi:hypothetical protein